MKPSHPGGFIKSEVLDQLGLSVTKAAEVLGVRRANLSDLVNKLGGRFFVESFRGWGEGNCTEKTLAG